MRIRHQVEKRRGSDKQNIGLIEVQMITCGKTNDPKESESQVMLDLLAITMFQKRKMLVNTSSEEEKESNLDEWAD